MPQEIYIVIGDFTDYQNLVRSEVIISFTDYDNARLHALKMQQDFNSSIVTIKAHFYLKKIKLIIT